MNIETLKQELRSELVGRQCVLTKSEIDKIVESAAIVEAAGIDSGDDVSKLLKERPQLANHVIDEIARVTLIEAVKYVYEDWLKQELNATAEEFYASQFEDGFSPVENAMALFAELKQAMEQYWPTDAKGIGSIALRNQLDALAEAESIVERLTHEPGYAHPLLERLQSVCQQSDAFKEEFSRRWELARDVADNRELFEIDRALEREGYSHA